MAIQMGVYAKKLDKIKESVKEGTGDSPTAEIFEPAKKAAKSRAKNT